ncbi:MAG TPA: FAD-binding oxidoreductase [Candidatus Limnocylindrales bacterium]|nr:FAD-binding oxidoreductase [Candidatus Limnocylindrales bacterium]
MSNSQELAAALRRDVAGLEVVEDPSAIEARSRDYWMRSLLESRLHGAPRAAALVRPASAAQVADVLAFADRTRTPVTPYGLGSGVCGGVLAQGNEIILDLSRMDRLLAVDENTLTATVQPGMRGSDYEDALAARGFTMGHWPQSIAISSVGGWCATRASGQLSTLYGNIEQMLLGAEVALAGGKLLRLPPVPRSATGPDLKHLFLGSEGTLGVFTELTFRIHAAPEKKRGSAFVLPSVRAGLEALRKVMRSGWTPAVTRLYDEIEAGRNFAGVAGGKPVLLIMSEGAASRVDAEAAAIAAIVAGEGGSDQGEEPVLSWLEHRNKVPTFERLLDQGLVADTIEVAIDWNRIGDLFEAVTARGARIESVFAMSGHVSHCYTQGANIYFTFVAAQSDLAAAVRTYDEAWKTTIETTIELGGTIAHHHGIGRVRKPYMTRELGEGVELLRALKRTFDPNGILNPGVLVDA